MPFSLLLAMQAAGMVVDWFGSQNQTKMARMGMQINEAGIETNIYQTRLETEDASLQGLKSLRQNLGTQIALFAARGTSTAGGSAVSLLNESVGNFNSDERVRRLNAMGRENQLRGGAAINRLQSMSDTSKLWQGFANRTVNRFPSTYAGWKAYGEGFGMTSSGS